MDYCLALKNNLIEKLSFFNLFLIIIQIVTTASNWVNPMKQAKAKVTKQNGDDEMML